MNKLLFLDPSDPRWLALLQSDPTATVFHHPAWMHLMQVSYGFKPFVAALVDENKQLWAGLPFAEVNTYLTPRRWVALPFSDYCNPLYRNEEAFSELIGCLVERHQSGHCPQIEIRANLPFHSGIQTLSPYLLHTVPLESDSSRVGKRIYRQQMQNVRKAEKNNIKILHGTSVEDMQAFYHLHCLSRRRHGVPVQPWKFFQNLLKELIEPGLGFVMLAYHENKCISGGVFLHWQKTLTYKYSATDEVHQNLQPNHLVTWTAMQLGCSQGDLVFDFGRADLADEGLREFKRRWGAEENVLSYSYIPQAPAKQEPGLLAGILKSVINRAPVWFCKAAGELLYRFAA